MKMWRESVIFGNVSLKQSKRMINVILGLKDCLIYAKNRCDVFVFGTVDHYTIYVNW
jgi:hypothetical protein